MNLDAQIFLKLYPRYKEVTADASNVRPGKAVVHRIFMCFDIFASLSYRPQ